MSAIFNKYRIYRRYLLFISFLTAFCLNSFAGYFDEFVPSQVNQPDTIDLEPQPDLPFPFKDPAKRLYPKEESSSGLYLGQPSNYEKSVEYDPETNEYIVEERFGSIRYKRPVRMTLDEYRDYSFNQSLSEYWLEKQRNETGLMSGGFLSNLNIESEALNKIFGSSTVSVEPQGSAELIFGLKISRVDDPSLSEDLRRTTTFDFDTKIQMNVQGQIGDKMKLGISYDTEATFKFENKAKLEYTGDEDEIIKKIEAGNVSLPLAGSLISGSQSLFGLKTQLQFGRLTVTSVFSQQKGKSKNIEVKGGAQTQEFEVEADDYDANKHFFLTHYFRNSYDDALSTLPIISSNVNILKIEVWVTNKRGDFENSRNIVALMDLAENVDTNIYNDNISTTGRRFPNNDANDLYNALQSGEGIRDVNTVSETIKSTGLGMEPGRDYNKIENARRLRSSEYTLNERLGYISLNSSLNADEVLAVAFSYTAGGRTYQVGEFSNEGIDAPKTLMVKMLKGTNLSPRLKTWDLMMKNIYSIGAYQVNSEEFVLNVLYQDDKSGNNINYIPEKELNDNKLIEVLNLDNLNTQLDPYPDGRFDYIEGITIMPSSGRIIFPVLEPFGSSLAEYINNEDKVTGLSDEERERIIDQYLFSELYDSTQTKAKQTADKNKFIMTGTYRSASSSEINLNAMNIPDGSVKVTAGGRQLEENIDYTVDYSLGRVKILNEGILESGTPINISLESNELFDFQTKTMVGTHLDYKVSDDFNIGGTVLNLTERPLTKKVSLGNEPISNTIWGLNSSYRTESQFITTLVDRIPLIETKEISRISLTGEFAQLVPGHSKVIGKRGDVYIDDFEGSKTSIDMKHYTAWSISSTPRNPVLFPESETNNNLSYGMNRARLAWYVIDPLFFEETSAATPSYIKNNPDVRSNFFVYDFKEKSLFPERENPYGIDPRLQTLNVAFYPSERGPYNYDTTNITETGQLANPEERWGGMMRSIRTNDFESANIEFIEFWMMEPFVYDTNGVREGGYLYFNLGNVSEDILKDSRKAFENGLPTSDEVQLVDSTVWGRVPIVQSLVNAFNNDPGTRAYQDVGLDGLPDEDEELFFQEYLDALLRNGVNPNSPGYQEILNDPSSDNYHYYKGENQDGVDYEAKEMKLGILQRYKRYNGLEGNSPSSAQMVEDYSTVGSTLPDVEDINQDNTLSEVESYYQYRIRLDPRSFNVGDNFIVDSVNVPVEFENDKEGKVNWYQFRIPVQDYEKKIGPIEDFKSIRFMRMFLHGFSDSVIIRLASLDLVRSDWRKYENTFREGSEQLTSPELSEAGFDLSVVNIEENSKRKPVNYVLPPGIDRVIDPYNRQITQLNEQSLVLKVNGLDDGDARAAYKNTFMDMRRYGRLEMEVHAEAIHEDLLRDDETTIFIRIGSDYTNNFYEYEIPLKLTPHLEGESELYSNGSQADRQIVWPEENRLDIPLEIFQQIKQERNDRAKSSDAIDYSTVYAIRDKNSENNWVKISGNPNLSNIKTVMIGIRNPSRNNHRFGEDDGLSKSVEVWVNELRLSDFDQDGGWAATARANTQLADFGSLTIAGNTSSPGFGSLQEKTDQRQKERILRYDISTNLNLGKFFPQDWAVNIPMYAGYSENIITPEFNPMDPDIPLRASLRNADSKREKELIKENAQSISQRKSLNFTNIRINKRPEEPKLYSLPNFSMSYSYSEDYSYAFDLAYRVNRQDRLAFTYNYNLNPKNIQPFVSVQGNALRIIRDINFYYLPSNISLRTDFNRRFSAERLRNIENKTIADLKDDEENSSIQPNFITDFKWNRNYTLNYNLTRALRIDFSATANSRIDAPYDELKETFEDEYWNEKNEEYRYYFRDWKSSVYDTLFSPSTGRLMRYQHNINANYTVPINKLPGLDWVNLNTRYSANYGWQAGPILRDEDTQESIGNTIKNSNTLTINSTFQFMSLYNKVPYLRNLNQQFRLRNSGRKPEPEKKRVTYTAEGIELTAGEPVEIVHRLKTENVEVITRIGDTRRILVDTEVISDSRVAITSDMDYEDVIVEVTGIIEEKDHPVKVVIDHLLHLMMATRNIAISYSENNGSMIPGYMSEPKYIGLSRDFNDPGLDFITGKKYVREDVQRLEQRGLLTRNGNISTPYSNSKNTNLNLRASFEPINGLTIDLNATHSKTKSFSGNYSIDSLGGYDYYGDITRGNFSMSYIAIGTAFSDELTAENNYESKSFNKFKDEIRGRIQERLFEKDPSRRDFANRYDSIQGYGTLSQEALIPSFLAPSAFHSPDKVTLKTFPGYLDMLPNWRVTYDGLSKIEFLQPIFRSIRLTHSYRSSYNIGSYQTNINYNSQGNGESSPGNQQIEGYNIDFNGNFIPQYEINNVSLTEQFSPLINVDVTWANNLTTRFEIKKDRALALSLANNQVTETRGQEYVFGTGYRFNDVEIIITTGSGQQTYQSDLNVRADFSIRDNITLIRQLLEDVDRKDGEAKTGQRVMSLKFSADYVLNERFKLRAFFDRIVNRPYTSRSFPNYNTEFGFSIRFNLIP